MTSKKINPVLLAVASLFSVQASSVFASEAHSSSMVLALTTEQGIWVLGAAVVIFFLFDQVLTVVLKAYASRKTRRGRGTVSLAVRTEKKASKIN